MTKKLYISPLNHTNVFTVYETRFLLAMQYPLHITTINHKKLFVAQKPFTNFKQVIYHLYLSQGHVRRDYLLADTSDRNLEEDIHYIQHLDRILYPLWNKIHQNRINILNSNIK